MRIIPEQIITYQLFPEEPYFRPEARKLIEASKDGNFEEVERIINENR